MKFAPIRTAGVLMLAFVGSAALLTVLITAIWLLTVESAQPGDILPAQETLFVAFNPTEQDLNRMSAFFPELDRAPSLPIGTKAVAILALPDGTRTTVTLTKGTNTGESIPPFHVQADTPQALELLRKTSGVLAQFKPFQSLAHARSQDARWIYFRTADTQAPAHIADIWWRMLLFGNSRFVALSTATGSLQIDRPLEEKSGLPSRMSEPAPLSSFSGAFLAVQSKDPLQEIGKLFGILPQATQSAFHAIALTAMQSVFGERVSWEFDVAPLLQGETVIVLRHTAEGVQFGIRGNSDSATLTSVTIEKILESSESTAAMIDVQEHVFDKRFPAVNIRMGTGGTLPPAKQENGWHIYKSNMPEEGGALRAAIFGPTFILANSGDLLTALRAPQTGSGAEHGAKATMGYGAVTTAEGIMDPEQAQAFLQNMLGDIGTLQTALFPMESGSTALRWRSSRDTGRASTVLWTGERMP